MSLNISNLQHDTSTDLKYFFASMAPKRLPKRAIQVKHEQIANVHSNFDIEDAGKLVSPCAPAQAGPTGKSDCNTCALGGTCVNSTETTEKIAMSTDLSSDIEGDTEYFEGLGIVKDKYVPVLKRPRVRLSARKLKAKTNKSRWSNEVSDDVGAKAASKEPTSTMSTISGTHHGLTDCAATNTFTNAKASVEIARACLSPPAVPSSTDLAWADGHDMQDFFTESADAIDADSAEENSLVISGKTEEV
ncbi:hypothetical protein N7G274_005564 [Stereocaulon virgatum]|uniref:Uncharacterized protein n=1 Tax=Stereocaulon virgatum TaxID=373712 RepID=A0ABR4A7K1_9LECA